MLDINLIRQNPELVKEGIAKKGADPKLVDSFLLLDEEWRAKTMAIDNLRTEQKLVGGEMARNKTTDLLSKAEIIKKQLSTLELQKKELEEKRRLRLNLLPNLPSDKVPPGKNESENKMIREIGKKTKFRFSPRDYLSLTENLGIIDVRRAAKTSGSRFGFLMGTAALLEFAVINFVIQELKAHSFKLVIPPVLINEKSMWGMGYLDQGIDEIYHLPKDNLYLVGTAEQSIGAMHQDEIFEEKELPKRYLAFSTCFRREAGSYGKDTKGILRVHQFDKLEMFSFVTPENSDKEHQFFLSLEENLMQKLKIPYRVMNICTGDLGAAAAAKYDIEAWLPGQNQYRETHSTSNCTDFQARRLNIRYKSLESEAPAPAEISTDKQNSKLNFVHTVNGTAFALGRIIIAIIENYQTENGSIKIPKVLAPYIKKIS